MSVMCHEAEVGWADKMMKKVCSAERSVKILFYFS